MFLVEVVVAVSVVVVGYHLFGLALEAHTLLASTAGDSVAPVDTDDGYLALLVGALPHTVLLHVLLEGFVSTALGFLASDSRMVFVLNKDMFTLHSMQYVPRQTSQSMWSFLIMLICLHPALKQKVITSACLVRYWLVARVRTLFQCVY